MKTLVGVLVSMLVESVYVARLLVISFRILMAHITEIRAQAVRFLLLYYTPNRDMMRVRYKK